MAGKRHTTIKDVAKRAGVSISTVSRVLNGLDRVNDDTKEKILRVIEELNFTPNNIAASLVTKKTKMIGIVVPEIINSFYSAVIHGVEEYAKANGYNTLIFSLNNDPQQELDMCNGVVSMIVDGLITLPITKDLSIYDTFDCPIVLVDRYLPGYNKPSVVIDNFGGTYLLTQHLIEKGHRKIGLINGPKTFNVGQEREAGYLQALRDNGIIPEARYQYEGEWYESTGQQGTRYFVGLSDPPTALLCTNNLICMGAIQELYDTQKKIGEDISIVGFDDNVLAKFVSPKVTVIDRPTVEMGRESAKILLDLIEGRSISEIKRTLGVWLVERNSVKNLRQMDKAI